MSRTANAAAELRRFSEVRLARSVDDIVRLLQRIEARAISADIRGDLPLPSRVDKKAVEKSLDLLDETPLLRRSAAAGGAASAGAGGQQTATLASGFANATVGALENANRRAGGVCRELTFAPRDVVKAVLQCTPALRVLFMPQNIDKFGVEYVKTRADFVNDSH